jgi:hypothetical protein
LNQWGAKFGNPAIFVSLVEWANRIIVECKPTDVRRASGLISAFNNGFDS